MPTRLAMDDIVMKVDDFLRHYDSTAPNEFDGTKSLEIRVFECIDLSSSLTGEGKFELALKKAEEADRVLTSLKTTILRIQQQRLSSRPNSSSGPNMDTAAISGHNDTRQPMTTGVNLFDLSIMVKSNLAARLKNNGRLDSSLELYTQLCKMAIDQTGGPSSFISEPNGNQQQLQQSKYLLHRFGLNIGNILYEMKEYQRALKHYRLTLDRLSSLAGNRNVQIKLMNNITIALMAMNGILSDGDELAPSSASQSRASKAGALGGLSKTNDHITSLQLLLNDNSYETVARQQTQSKPSNEIGNNAARQVLNGNHHKFGLNLVVCQHREHDLASVYTTLRSLLHVDCSGSQYKRVLNFDKFSLHEESAEYSQHGQALVDNKSSLVDINKLLLDEILSPTVPAHAATDSLSGNARDKLAEHNAGEAYEQSSRYSNDGPSRYATTKRTISSGEQQRQVMASARADELEKLICAKEFEIQSALIRSCSLAIDLDRRTSALSQCSKLVATSDLYKALREDLWANNVLRLLLATRPNLLNTGLYVLERVGSNQQVGTIDPVAVVSPTAGVTVESSSSKSLRLAQPTGQASKCSPPHVAQLKSPLVATNLGLLYLLRRRVDIALKMNGQALSLDKSNVEGLVNMANCQMELDEHQRAERLYALTLSIRPDHWVAYSNRLLASIKLGYHPDDIRDLLNEISKMVKADGASRRQSLMRFTLVRMAMIQLQLAALYRQSGMIQKSSSILRGLLVDGCGPELSPEICLLASKCPTNDNHNSSPSTQKPVTILQQTLRFHPYHIPTAERLIALYISEFNYTSAIQVLTDCIKNRPDQVRWYQMLAECHRRGANYNEAIKIYKHVMDIFPMNESCVKALAKLADELGLEEERNLCQTRLQQQSKAKVEA